MKLLIVDDDPKLRDYLARGLRESGLECDVAADAEKGWELVEASRARPFDLVLLDVMLPGAHGWEFLERLRASGDETPVIFLTAREGVTERVRGLELGADDYVIKPFELSELSARIHAVLRRRRALPVLRAGDLRLDLARHTVERAGEPIDVSAREFDLLRALVEGRGKVRSRRELLRGVWGIEFEPGTNVVDVSIARLRRKLERRGPPLIRTVVGEGYALEAREGEAG